MVLIRKSHRREVFLLLIGLTVVFVIASFWYDGSPLSSHKMGDVPASILNSLSHNSQWTGLGEADRIAHPEPDLGLADTLPSTTILAHAPGWTLFQNLYMSNGTLFIVTPEESRGEVPEIRMMTSTGLAATVAADNIAAREPTDREMQVITPEKAQQKWGGDLSANERHRVWTVEGQTFLVNEPSQFLDHYYHFVAELFLGAWAFLYGAFNPHPGSASGESLGDSSKNTVASSSPRSAPSFNKRPTTYSPPDFSRIIFLHAATDGWRDKPGFNSYFLRAVLPSVDVEVAVDWIDRINATLSPSPSQSHPQFRERAWHFPVALLSDRSASFRGEACGSRTQRIAGEAWEAMRARGAIDPFGEWWRYVRESVGRFAGITQASGDSARSGASLGAAPQPLPLVPVDPRPSDNITDTQSLLPVPEQVVITYINRQGVRRHLIPEDHDTLVGALEELIARKAKEGKNWILRVIQPERLSKDEQVRLAADTTILLGVHGNGLTHLVLMQPNKYSSVIEMFYRGGFARDYEWTARALGMRHYSVWNDTYFTHPNEPPLGYPEGFQGTKIPVHGATVAKLIEERLEGRLQY